ncbi:DNA-directed DNA polymerase [Sporobolomyces koalae]|uniref:DNA-directed DNA polymerase n=1 Tax=Sporobolomyces koalae TaxID=500713 RepID=UPI00317F5D10
MPLEASGATPTSLSAATEPHPDSFIRFRLSAIDSVPTYERSPYDNRRSPYSKELLRQVPVIRIFGATDKGQRVCAHVHGAFPYVFVEYKGKMDPDSVNDYIRRFGASLNSAMALSLPSKHKQGQSPQYVAFIVMCKGVPFYGYHVGYRPFLKIYMVNPIHKKRLSECLRSGAVLGTEFDVFEDHIPFLLQFMLDANLYGCGWVEVGECLLREGVPEYVPPKACDAIYTPPPTCQGPYAHRVYVDLTVPSTRLHPSVDDGGPAKVSYSALELDLPVSAILNKQSNPPRKIHHDFIEKLHPETVETGKLVRSVKELWDDERRRRTARGESGPYDLKDDARREFDLRDKDDTIWRTEATLRAKVEERAKEDLRTYRTKMGPKGRGFPEFETYVADKEKIEASKTMWMDMVRTTFEQVDAIYVSRFEEDEMNAYPFGAWAVKGVGLGITAEQEKAWERDVDMTKLLASQSAAKAARRIAKTQAKNAGIDTDEEDEFESLSELDEDGGSGLESGHVAATQHEALRIERMKVDRIERRGREGSVAEAEWDKEPSDGDEEELKYWGLADADTASERDPLSVSPASIRSVSASPLKRSAQSSPSKRSRLDKEIQESDSGAETDLDSTPRPKRVKVTVPDPLSKHQSAAVSPAPLNGQTFPPAITQTPTKSAKVFPPSRGTMTPVRRPRHNPLSSGKKAVGVQFANRHSPLGPPPASIMQRDASEDEDSAFAFGEAEDETTDRPDSQPVAPPFPTSNHKPRPDIDSFATGNDTITLPARSHEPLPSRSRLQLTPSEILAETAGLPSQLFDEEYQPTPTVAVSQSSQVPLVLQSSTETLNAESLVRNDSHSSLDTVVHSETDTEVDEGDRTSKPVPRKQVAFQLQPKAPVISLDNTDTTATPLESTGESRVSSSNDPSVHLSQETAGSGSSTDPNHNRLRLPPASRFPLSRNGFVFAAKPPTTAELYGSLADFGLSKVVYKDPYYSKAKDVPRRAREFAGKRFVIEGDTVRFLKPFLHYGADPTKTLAEIPSVVRIARVTKWEFCERPPSKREAHDWLIEEGLLPSEKPRFNPLKSQIEGPTQKGDGFKFTPIAGAPVHREKQHMAVLALELHVNTRKHLLPDPKEDAIEAACYCLQSDNEDLVANGRSENTHVGVIVVGDESLRKQIGPTDFALEIVEDERQLVEVLLEKVRFEFDPECVSGYEVHHASWGYLLERAESEFSWNLVPELGRVKAFDTGKFGTKDTDRWGFNQSSTLNFSGRHVLPIWRILKADNKFQQYSFEHIAFHILRLRTPHFSFAKLTEWYQSGDPAKLCRVLQYWRNRVEMDIEMLDAAEIIDQNCESARVFGVDFKSVRTRGSQFKVESVMFKISKPESFLLLSPNRIQVGRQNAAECQPLIMEPKSAFYKGPLLVLDFQSLYPSVMIAYNYCYSTFLGRINSFKGTSKFGVQINLDQPPGLLHLMKDHINISPNGMMFVKPEVRKSLLAKMLSELLDTRVMVKGSMKAVASDRALTKLLNARQLALKFLANVTYGYTSATFSGRMPAVEVADAIVQTGRETLERALELIRNKKEWAAEVVYGDTDSLFVYLPGRSREEAFRIGNEMADEVTSQNPRPIKLKFEKVYLPCVLLAKKRYVGFKYERQSDLEPEFEAKGIETVRRDGIAATQKMQETCLKLLFRTSDLSLVKEYCQRQWSKLQAGDVSPQDFVIAKAVKLGSYAEGRDPPPGAVVATRAMAKDHRAEPEYGERVPYLLCQAEPGTKQIDRSISPGEFLAEPRLRLDVDHYILRMMVRPLERIFDLIGARVLSWYEEMPKSKRAAKSTKDTAATRRVGIDEHFKSDRCIACDAQSSDGPLCQTCRSHPAEVTFAVASRKAHLESRQRALHQICASCSQTPVIEALACDSLDCPNLYARVRNENELAKLRAIDIQF